VAGTTGNRHRLPPNAGAGADRGFRIEVRDGWIDCGGI